MKADTKTQKGRYIKRHKKGQTGKNEEGKNENERRDTKEGKRSGGKDNTKGKHWCIHTLKDAQVAPF